LSKKGKKGRLTRKKAERQELSGENCPGGGGSTRNNLGVKEMTMIGGKSADQKKRKRQ